MLENCSNILECERILSSQLDSIQYIGQVELTPGDIEILKRFIKENIPKGLDFIKLNMPICFVFFLVNQGIWGYKEGNYWTCISDHLGELEPTEQSKLGSFFLNFVKNHNLALFDTEGTYRYVAPILVHGGIPQACLDEYFDRIIMDLYDRGIIKPEEVKGYLLDVRERARERNKIEKELIPLKKERERVQKELLDLQALIEWLEKKEHILDVDETDRWDRSQLHTLAEYDRLQEELSELKEEIEKLQDKQQEHEKRISQITEEEKRILEYSELLEAIKDEQDSIQKEQEKLDGLIKEEEKSRVYFEELFKGFWREPFQEDYEPFIEAFDLDQISQKHYEYKSHQSRYHELEVQYMGFQFIQIKMKWTLWLGFILALTGIGFFRVAQLIAGILLFSGAACIGYGVISFIRDKRLQKKQRLEYEKLKQAMDQEKQVSEKLQQDISAIIGKLAKNEIIWEMDTPILVDVFSKIKKSFHMYQKLHRDRVQQMKNLFQWRARLELAATSLMPGEDGNPEERISKWFEQLDEVKQKAADASEASHIIEEKIKPALELFISLKTKLQEKLTGIVKQLADLGHGSIQEGILEVKRRLSVISQLEDINREISRIRSTLSFRKRDINTKAEIQALYAASENRLDAVQRQINQKEMKMEYTSALPSYIEEPIQRFILFGGEWAEEWLCESLRLVDDVTRTNRITEELRYNLPERVLYAFKAWWTALEQEINESVSLSSDTEKFVTPILMLDPILGAIKMVFDKQRLRYSQEYDKCEFFYEIKAENSDILSIHLPVRAYLNISGFIETEKAEIQLELLAEAYQVVLWAGDRILQQWNVMGTPSECSYLIFKEDGSRIPDNEYPSGRIWFLLYSDLFLDPPVQLIESTMLHFSDGSYALMLADMANMARVAIKEKGTGLELVSLRNKEEEEPFLMGGQLLAGVKVNDLPVYTNDLPRLVVPLDEKGSLKGWSMIVQRKAGSLLERAYYRLDELHGIDVIKGSRHAEIPLNVPELFGSDPVGLCIVSLRNWKRKQYTFRMAFIPDMIVDFDPFLYFPSHEGIKDIIVTMIFPENTRFTVESNGIVLSVVDEAYEIAVPESEECLRGKLELSLTEGEAIALPIEIELPKVKWRIQGLKGYDFHCWSYLTDEIWFGDWEEADELYLQVELPLGVGTYLQLCMDASDQSVVTQLKNRKAQMNLLAFTDTMKQTQTNHVFWIRVLNARYKELFKGALFAVRCQWEIVDTTYAIDNEGRNKNLRISWEEKGKVSNRVLRLWEMNEPWYKPKTFPIADGAKELVIDLEKSKLTPGKYLVQFDLEDPWLGTVDEPLFPKGSLNTMVVVINADRSCIENWEISWHSKKRAVISGRVAPIHVGSKAVAALIGIVHGRIQVKTGDGLIEKDGSFSILIESDDQMILKDIAHWLMIHVDLEIPIYQISTLPEPAILECEISNELCNYLMNSPFAFRLHLLTDQGVLYKGFLNTKVEKQIIKSWYQGDLGFVAYLGKKERSQYMNLRWAKYSPNGYMEFQSGVKCTTCGAILESQAEWDEKHYPRCKSLIPNYSERQNMKILLAWDYMPIYESLICKYLLAGKEIFTLFSNWKNPLPDGMEVKDLLIQGSEKIVSELLIREKQLADIIWKGEFVDGN